MDPTEVSDVPDVRVSEEAPGLSEADALGLSYVHSRFLITILFDIPIRHPQSQISPAEDLYVPSYFFH
jgi:hypothetical protein